MLPKMNELSDSNSLKITAFEQCMYSCYCSIKSSLLQRKETLLSWRWRIFFPSTNKPLTSSYNTRQHGLLLWANTRRELSEADFMALKSNHTVRGGIFGLSFYFFILPPFLFSFLLFTDLFFSWIFFLLEYCHVPMLNYLFFLMEMLFFSVIKDTALDISESQFPPSFFRAVFILSLSIFLLQCYSMVCFPSKSASIIIPVIYIMFYSFVMHFISLVYLLHFVSLEYICQNSFHVETSTERGVYCCSLLAEMVFLYFHNHISTEAWILSETY